MAFLKRQRQKLAWVEKPIFPGAYIALAGNMAYALYHGTLGIMGRSRWLMILCAYDTVLALARFIVVCLAQRCGNKRMGPIIMKSCGLPLVVLSMVLAQAVRFSLMQDVTPRYGTITMITLATWMFGKFGIAFDKALRRRGMWQPAQVALRNIRLAEIGGSILTLQRLMVVSFGDLQEEYAMCMWTGTAVCLFVLGMGSTMAINRKDEKAWQNQSGYGQIKPLRKK